jgi:hypothetical protein
MTQNFRFQPKSLRKQTFHALDFIHKIYVFTRAPAVMFRQNRHPCILMNSGLKSPFGSA